MKISTQEATVVTPTRERTKPTTIAELLGHPEATVPAWSAAEPNAAGSIGGMSRSTAYGLIRRGEFPVPVIRAGKHLRVSVAALLTLLGVEG